MTGLTGKRSRWNEQRKRRSALAFTMLESFVSNLSLQKLDELIDVFSLIMPFFALTLRVFARNRNAFVSMCFVFSKLLAKTMKMCRVFISLDSAMMDMPLEDGKNYGEFVKPRVDPATSSFINDDYCELWTRFKKSELHLLIKEFCLPQTIEVHRYLNKHCYFNAETLLIYAFTRLAHGQHHSYLSDVVFGGYQTH